MHIAADGTATCDSSGSDPEACNSTNDPRLTTDDSRALCRLMHTYVNPAIALFSGAIGIVVVISILIGAIQVTTSGDEPAKAAAGKKRIIEALIGLAAYLLLYSLLQFLVPGGLT